MTRQPQFVTAAELRRSSRESEILATCRELLRLRGWFCIRHQQGLGSHRGLSDLTAIKAGRVLWIEIKTPRGRLSQYQERFRADIMAAGGTYLTIDDPNELEQALQWLEAQEDGRPWDLIAHLREQRLAPPWPGDKEQSPPKGGAR